jgi:hypothetical protein
VTVASAGAKLFQIEVDKKNYMRSTMKQERLNGPVTIALESDVLEKIKYEDIVEDFILKNTRRMMPFHRS